MASESTQPVELNAIPNSVSGDGTTFVKGLKKYLSGYSNTVEDLIENSGIGQITNITLTEQHISQGGSLRNDIYISFSANNITNYSFAQIWVSEKPTEEWELNGVTSGYTHTVEDVTQGKTYYIKVIGCNKDAGYSDFNKATISSITINGSVLVCNSPKQFFWDNADNCWRWSGYEDNGHTDYFEIRTDQNPGVWNEHRLDVVTYSSGLDYSTVPPASRSGTAYLYVRNLYGTYNAGIAHIYAINSLNKPQAPVLSQSIDGVSIELQELPAQAKYYVVSVDGDEYDVYTSQWTYYQLEGTVSVKYCFVDGIGKSQWSDSVNINCGREIGSNNIATNAITSAKIATNAITADKVSAGAITVKKMDFTVAEGEELNVSNKITSANIQAKSIVGDSIAANTIRASSLYGETINLTNALQIVGGAVTVNQNGLTCKIGKTSGSVNFNSSGMTYTDRNGNVYTGLGRIMIGTATHGKRVTFKNAWDVNPSVICIPRQWQTQLSTYSNTNLYTECYASNVSTTGFDVVCRTFAQAGSYSSMNYNAGSVYSSTLSSSQTITAKTPNFTLSGDGSMSVTVNGNVTATGCRYYDEMEGVFDTTFVFRFYNYITSIKATLYIGGTSKGTKTLWTGQTTGTVTTAVSFNATYSGSQTAYISYDVTFTVDKYAVSEGTYSVQPLAGSATYKLNSATQVATGDVTFLVTDTSANSFYTVG